MESDLASHEAEPASMDLAAEVTPAAGLPDDMLEPALLEATPEQPPSDDETSIVVESAEVVEAPEDAPAAAAFAADEEPLSAWRPSCQSPSWPDVRAARRPSCQSQRPQARPSRPPNRSWKR